MALRPRTGMGATRISGVAVDRILRAGFMPLVVVGSVGQIVVAGDARGRFLAVGVVVGHDKMIMRVAGDALDRRERLARSAQKRRRYRERFGPDRRRRENRATA